MDCKLSHYWWDVSTTHHPSEWTNRSQSVLLHAGYPSHSSILHIRSTWSSSHFWWPRLTVSITQKEVPECRHWPYSLQLLHGTTTKSKVEVSNGSMKHKHHLAMHLAFAMLQHISQHLLPHQRFITAGAFEANFQDKALCVGNGTTQIEVLPQLKCCAEEQIWVFGCIASLHWHKETAVYTWHQCSTHWHDCFCIQGWLNVISLYIWIHLVQNKSSTSAYLRCQQASKMTQTWLVLPLKTILQTVYIVTGCDPVTMYHFLKESANKRFWNSFFGMLIL